MKAFQKHIIETFLEPVNNMNREKGKVRADNETLMASVSSGEVVVVLVPKLKDLSKTGILFKKVQYLIIYNESLIEIESGKEKDLKSSLWWFMEEGKKGKL